MSDGGESARDLRLYMRPNAEHVLDYSHITMHITLLQQMARSLPPPAWAVTSTIVEVFKSTRRFLWHRKIGRAIDLAEALDDGLDLLDDPLPQVRKLRRYLAEFFGYIASNAGFSPNCDERHRYSEVISIASVKSAVNHVIAKRSAKKQQLQ